MVMMAAANIAKKATRIFRWRKNGRHGNGTSMSSGFLPPVPSSSFSCFNVVVLGPEATGPFLDLCVLVNPFCDAEFDGLKEAVVEVLGVVMWDGVVDFRGT